MLDNAIYKTGADNFIWLNNGKIDLFQFWGTYYVLLIVKKIKKNKYFSKSSWKSGLAFRDQTFLIKHVPECAQIATIFQNATKQCIYHVFYVISCIFKDSFSKHNLFRFLRLNILGYSAWNRINHKMQQNCVNFNQNATKIPRNFWDQWSDNHNLWIT